MNPRFELDKTKPRKGTETRVPMVYFTPPCSYRLDKTKPRKGTETQLQRNRLRLDRTQLDKTKPRKGTETDADNVNDEQIHIRQNKTPKGDGNLYAESKEIRLEIRQNKTPKGDGNRTP